MSLLLIALSWPMQLTLTYDTLEWFHFYRATLKYRVRPLYAVVVCVRVSVTRRYCIKTAKRSIIIIQTTPHNRPGTLVL